MAEELNPVTNLETGPEKAVQRQEQRLTADTGPGIEVGVVYDKQFIENNNRELAALRGYLPIKDAMQDFKSYADNIEGQFNVYNTDIDLLRAAGQSGWKQAGNAIMQATISEFALPMIAGTYSLIAGRFTPAAVDGYSNIVSDAILKTADDFRDQFPIYQRAPGTFNMGDKGWWWSNLPSLASTLSLMLPALGVGAVASKALQIYGKSIRGYNATRRGSQLFQTLAKADTRMSRWAISGVTSAVASRHMESVLEAHGQYNETYENALYQARLKGLGGEEAEETARLAASEAAAMTYKNNWWMLMMDIPQYLLLGGKFSTLAGGRASAKVLGKTPSLLDNPIFQNRFYGIASGFVSEGFEEAFQFGVGMMANHNALYRRGLIEDKSFNKHMEEFFDDGEMWTAAFFGGLGGGLFQSGIGKSLKRFVNKKMGNDTEQERFEKLLSNYRAMSKAFAGKSAEMQEVLGEINNEVLLESFRANEAVQMAITQMLQGDEHFELYLDQLDALQNATAEDLEMLNIDPNTFELLTDEQRNQLFPILKKTAVEARALLDKITDNPTIDLNVAAEIVSKQFRLNEIKAAIGRNDIKVVNATNELDSSFNIRKLTGFGKTRLDSMLEVRAQEEEIKRLQEFYNMLKNATKNDTGATFSSNIELAKIQEQINTRQAVLEKAKEKVAKAKEEYKEADLTEDEKASDNSILKNIHDSFIKVDEAGISTNPIIKDYVVAKAEQNLLESQGEILENIIAELYNNDTNQKAITDKLIKDIEVFSEETLNKFTEEFDERTKSLSKGYKDLIRVALNQRKVKIAAEFDAARKAKLAEETTTTGEEDGTDTTTTPESNSEPDDVPSGTDVVSKESLNNKKESFSEEKELSKEETLAQKKNKEIIEKTIKQLNRRKEIVDNDRFRIEQTLEYLKELLNNTATLSNLEIERILNNINNLESLITSNSKKRSKRGKFTLNEINNYKDQIKNEYQFLNDIANRVRELTEELKQLEQISKDLNEQSNYYSNLLKNKSFKLFNETELKDQIKKIEKKQSVIAKLIKAVKSAINKTLNYLKEYLGIATKSINKLDKFTSNFKTVDDTTLRRIVEGKEEITAEEYFELKKELEKIENEVNENLDNLEFIEAVKTEEEARLEQLKKVFLKYDRQIRYLNNLIDILNKKSKEVKITNEASSAPAAPKPSKPSVRTNPDENTDAKKTKPNAKEAVKKDYNVGDKVVVTDPNYNNAIATVTKVSDKSITVEFENGKKVSLLFESVRAAEVKPITPEATPQQQSELEQKKAELEKLKKEKEEELNTPIENFKKAKTKEDLIKAGQDWIGVNPYDSADSPMGVRSALLTTGGFEKGKELFIDFFKKADEIRVKQINTKYNSQIAKLKQEIKDLESQSQINVGDEVIPKAGKYKGQVGKVIGFLNNGRVQVQFENGQTNVYSDKTLDKIVVEDTFNLEEDPLTDPTNNATGEEQTSDEVEGEEFNGDVNDGSQKLEGTESEFDVSTVVEPKFNNPAFNAWRFSEANKRDARVRIRLATAEDINNIPGAKEDYKKSQIDTINKFNTSEDPDDNTKHSVAVVMEVLDDSGNVLTINNQPVQTFVYTAKEGNLEKLGSNRRKMATLLKNNGGQFETTIKAPKVMPLIKAEQGKVTENNIIQVFGENFEIGVTNHEGQLRDLSRSTPLKVNNRTKTITSKKDPSKILKGDFFIKVKNPNGPETLVKLNIKHYTPQQANLIYNLVASIVSKPSNATVAINQFPAIATEFKKIYGEQFYNAVTNNGSKSIKFALESLMHINAGNNKGKNTDTRFTSDKNDKFLFGNGANILVANQEKNNLNDPAIKEKFIDFLVNTKRHRVNPDLLATSTEYRDFILNNNILNTDIVPNVYQSNDGSQFTSIFAFENSDGYFPGRLYINLPELSKEDTQKEVVSKAKEVIPKESLVLTDAVKTDIANEGKKDMELSREEIYNSIKVASETELFKEATLPLEQKSPGVLKMLNMREQAIDKQIALNNANNPNQQC